MNYLKKQKTNLTCEMSLAASVHAL